METTKEHARALEKTKIALMSRPDSVFYSELAFSLKHHFTDRVPTAATNGVSVMYNPDFFMEQNPEQRLGLMLHEVMHVVYAHMLRLRDRDPRDWNRAGDHVINLGLLERGFKLPEGGLHDIRFTGMNTDQVYAIIRSEEQSEEPFDLDLLPPPNGMDVGEIEDNIAQAVIRAAIRSAQEGDKPGTIPGDIQIFIDNLLKPKLPWQNILARWIQAQSKEDYTFRKPNRRFMPDHYLPSLHSQKLLDLAWATDTSGSVTDHEFHTAISEVAGVMRMLKPEKMTFLQFDTTLKSVETLKNIRDLMKVEFTGRGGTDIGQLIEWANKNKPKLLIVFTDGCFNFKHYETQVPVIWLIHNNPGFVPKFGRAIHYKI